MNDQIKRENRKAMPRFVLLMALAVLVGLVSGSGAIWLRQNGAEDLPAAAAQMMNAAAPWMIPALFVLVSLPCALALHRCRQEVRSWDGEEEAVAERVERRINYVVLFSNLCAVANLLIMTGAVTVRNGPTVLVVLVEFLASLAVLGVQQKTAVDLLKTMNPEKRGSVLDVNFRKKWMASCDEAERKRAGEAAFAAFWAVNMTCGGLWLVCMVLDTIFDTGVLPFVILAVILGAANTAYSLTEIRAGRKS